MDRKQYGKGYLIEQQDWNDLQDNVEESINSVAVDADIEGIFEDVTKPENERELAVVQNDVLIMDEVDLLLGTARDKLGNRIFVPSKADINISQDDDSASTAVGTSGKEKWVALFIEFDRQYSDKDFDDDGLEYYQTIDDHFTIHILQSAEFDDTLSLPDKKLLRPIKPLASPHWLYLADVLKYYGMSQIVDADIHRDRKEAITIGNAKTLGFDNDSGKFDSGVDNVDEALEELVSRTETVEDFELELDKLFNQNYSLGKENIALYFDKASNRLYTSSRETTVPLDVSVTNDGTYHFYAILSEADYRVNKIICRIYDKSGDEYSNDLTLDEGLVYAPKTLVVGTEYIVVYLYQSTISAPLEIRYRRLTLDTGGGVLTLAVDASVDDVNNYSTYPVQDGLTTIGENLLYDGVKKAFDIAYDSVNDKIGIIWVQSTGLAFRNIDNTHTPSTLTVVPVSVTIDDGVAMDFNDSLFLLFGSSDDDDTVITNTVDNALAIGTERTLSVSNFVLANFKYCDNDAGIDYGIAVGLNTGSNVCTVIRVISDNSANPTLLGSVSAGGNVDGVLGGVWNPSLDLLSVFYRDETNGYLYYREFNTGAVGGTDTQITTTTEFDTYSLPIYLSGVGENYHFLGFEISLTAPFNQRKTRLYFLDDGAGTIDYQWVRQGDGGYFVLHIKNNPERFVKAHFTYADGEYVTVADKSLFYVDIDESEFVTSGYNVRTVTIDYALLSAMTMAYNKPIIYCRVDDLNDSGLLGLHSDRIPKNDRWFEGKAVLDLEQVRTRHIADNVVTVDKLVGYGEANGVASVNALGKVPDDLLPPSNGIARYIVCDPAISPADGERVFNTLKAVIEYVEWEGEDAIGRIQVLAKPDGSKWTYPVSGSGKLDLLRTIDKAQTGTTNTITLSSKAIGDTYGGTAGNKDDEFVGRTIRITSGLGNGQKRKIDAYDSGTFIATVDENWSTVPDSTSVYQIGLDWSDIEIIFERNANYKGSIRLISNHEDYSSVNLDRLGNKYSYSGLTFTRTSGAQTHLIDGTLDYLFKYPYLQIAGEFFEIASVTSTTIVLDAATPYYGQTSNVTIWGFRAAPFRGVMFNVHIENENSDITGLDFRGVFGELHGSLRNCSLTKESITNFADPYGIGSGFVVAGAIFVNVFMDCSTWYVQSIKNVSLFDFGGGVQSTSAGAVFTSFSELKFGFISNCYCDYEGAGLRPTNCVIDIHSVTQCYTEYSADGGGAVTSYGTSMKAKVISYAESNYGGCIFAKSSHIEVDLVRYGIANVGYGGGIVVEGNSVIKAGEVIGCTAVTYGGGVCVDAGVTVSPVIIVGNILVCTAGTSGGGIWFNNVTEFQIGAVINCSALDGDGGGLYSNASQGKIGTLKGCSATDGNGGGAAVLLSSYLQVGKVNSCSAIFSTINGSGGGLYIADGTVEFGAINACSADKQGGGVLFGSGTLIGGNINNCDAGDQGGGIYKTSGNVRVGDITQCSAVTQGGGIYSASSGGYTVQFGRGSGNTGGGVNFYTASAEPIWIGGLATGQSTNVGTNTHFKTSV